MIKTLLLICSGAGMAGIITSVMAVMDDPSGRNDRIATWLLVASLCLITASLIAFVATED